MPLKNIIQITIFSLLLILFSITSKAQVPPVFNSTEKNDAQTSKLTRSYLAPTRIVWKDANGGSSITNEELLLQKGSGQADLSNNKICFLKNDNTNNTALLFDFGKEIHGGIQLVTGASHGEKTHKVRICFGESVSEAMSSVGEKGATNNHAIRDMIVEAPYYGSIEIGNTGFRFVRIELIEPNAEMRLKEVRAVFTYQDIPYKGSFHCSDSLLNKIWMTGAYTVHLNMQDYLWDGIKRDRLVWIGDMHPEVSTINSVFGYNECVPKSLDLTRDITPVNTWMNGISSYSMWWIILHKDWYLHHGNLPYLKEQQSYLVPLLKKFCSLVDENGKYNNDGWPFLDWPSSNNPEAIQAGLHSLVLMSLSAGKDLCTILNEKATADECERTINKLKTHIPNHNNSKQAAALLSLSNLIDAQKGNDIISNNGVNNFSTFYGYYMLQAMAKANNHEGAMNSIREYWGGMLNIGATTFWEDFNIKWLDNAMRIDELPQEGKKDIHADYGDYCYKGLRHSLCHGWASGPTAWLTQHVLGIEVIEAGSKTIKIAPNLGKLEFAEGTFPTPNGTLYVKHEKDKNGKIKSIIQAPKGVKIIK